VAYFSFYSQVVGPAQYFYKGVFFRVDGVMRNEVANSISTTKGLFIEGRFEWKVKCLQHTRALFDN
jgi:hypothetical protein